MRIYPQKIGTDSRRIGIQSTKHGISPTKAAQHDSPKWGFQQAKHWIRSNKMAKYPFLAHFLDEHPCGSYSLRMPIIGAWVTIATSGVLILESVIELESTSAI